MRETKSAKNPWVAAILGVIGTGLGHIYLKRWRRAIGWILVMFLVSSVFVDPAMVESLLSGQSVDQMAYVPVLIVGSVSALDAYLVAHIENALGQSQKHESGTIEVCPNCRNELDDDLDFCHWCGFEVEKEADTGSPAVND